MNDKIYFQDTAGAEELSVKTLANMFDFKQTEAYIAKNEHKMRESKKGTFSGCKRFKNYQRKLTNTF